MLVLIIQYFLGSFIIILKIIYRCDLIRTEIAKFYREFIDSLIS